MEAQQHPFNELTNLIVVFNEERNSMTLEDLQDLREKISLNFFLMADSAARAVANYDSKEFERKRTYASSEQLYRTSIDESTGKIHTVSDAERKARLENKKIDDELVEALRQKEKVRIIINAVGQILNSISTRISQLSNR